MLAGVHVGCFELFGTDRVHTIRDLKGKTVAVPSWAPPARVPRQHGGLCGPGSPEGHHLGHASPAEAMPLLAEGKIDAFLGFPPDPQELRAKQIGHVVVNSTCGSALVAVLLLHGGRQPGVRPQAPGGHQTGAARPPEGDRRLCPRAGAGWPASSWTRATRSNYDYALQAMKEIPYDKWREYDPEDTVRFYALRLHEAGMIKSSPQKIIAQGTDWRFLNAAEEGVEGIEGEGPVEQGQGATISPTDDVTDVRGPRQREAPGPWSRRVSTVSLPSPAPNNRVQPTASSVRSAPASGSG